MLAQVAAEREALSAAIRLPSVAKGGANASFNEAEVPQEFVRCHVGAAPPSRAFQ